MANTLPDFTVVSTEWTDVYTLTGIAVGNTITICNKGGYNILIQESDTQPLPANNDGKLLASYVTGSNNATVEGSISKVWLKAAKGSCDVNVQSIN